MKRFLLICLIFLLLCGCAQEPVPEETSGPVQTEIPVPTEPTGSYEPDSAMERKTGGAVRSYRLPIRDGYDLVCLGTDVVVFSGTETTTLTMFSGENLFASARIELDQYISPSQPSTQVTAKGISYFSADTGELVLLDTALKEVARIAVPDGLTGTPVMSDNRKLIYYCTETSVRVLDLETGISRLLLEIGYPEQTAQQLLMNDTVLQCSLTDENGRESLLFLSAEDGSTLYETREDIRVATCGQRYYATVPEGAMKAVVFGSGTAAGSNMLLPRDVTAGSRILAELDAVVTENREDGEITALEYYSLSDGRRSSVLELEEGWQPISLAAMQSSGMVYVLCADAESEANLIYRWDVGALQTNDGEIYTGPRYTLDAPDAEGLAQCREYALELGQRYGVEILLGKDATAVQPWDYTLEAEYQVPLIRRELDKLSSLLSAYPEQFLGQAADNTSSGVIRIALVRSITGTPETGIMESAQGAHYWINENPYIALAVGQIDGNVLYHELYHAMESKIFADSQIYYEWDKLNPKDFVYDYDYTHWQNRGESDWLTEENRAFIDSFSMTFPMEDRARIMEYAMTEGNAHYFQSEIMQEKLHQLCLGIRKAFGLTKSQEVYLWEQYLTEPLAYVPKK